MPARTWVSSSSILRMSARDSSVGYIGNSVAKVSGRHDTARRRHQEWRTQAVVIPRVNPEKVTAGPAVRVAIGADHRENCRWTGPNVFRAGLRKAPAGDSRHWPLSAAD